MPTMTFLKRIKNALMPGPTIRFKCHTGRFDVAVPVETTQSVTPKWLGKQIKEKSVKFRRCPGMSDYSRHGYLISAWCDITIKANSMGVSIVMPDHIPDGMKPVSMDFSVIDGLAPIGDDVAKKVFKLPSPWGIFTRPGYSAMVLAADMHFPFADKLHIYPGIVDYDEFHQCNVIASVLKECEFTIPAGTPLLQVIPFKREKMSAVSGKATELEYAFQFFKFASRVTGYYYRKFHHKKQFTIKIEDQDK